MIYQKQFYINKLKLEYNILKIAGSLLKFIYSKDIKLIISKTLTDKNYPMYNIISENHLRFDVFLPNNIVVNKKYFKENRQNR